MIMLDFIAISQQCAPTVHHATMEALVRVESNFNPYAIGIVRGHLVRQPRNKAEAIATAKQLDKEGYNFSMGLGQVNRYNLKKYALSYDTVFNTCDNLRASSLILLDCFNRATNKTSDKQSALQAAFSCYYSGNFSTGFKEDFEGQPSYVQKILNSSNLKIVAVPNKNISIRSTIKPVRTVRELNETETAMVFN